MLERRPWLAASTTLERRVGAARSGRPPRCTRCGDGWASMSGSPSVGAERGAERVGRRGVRDGRQPARRSVLEAAPARVGRRRRGDAGRVRGAVAGSVLPGPRRRRRRQGGDRDRSSTRRCAISPTWICGWSATTSPRPTSKARPRPSDRFPSKAFGYSRDHRSDRPQVVIGLLCTGDGIPIAHHVFAGNTADVSTLPGVLDDLQDRFGVGRICVVADRGLISADNVEVVAGHGFDHVLATRLHRDPTCAEALTASAATRRRVGAGARRPLAPPATSPSPTAAAPSSSPASNGTAATPSAPPSSSPAPRPSCSPSRTGSAPAGSSTPARSAAPPNASSAPPASGACSTSRSPRAASSTTTTTTAFAYEELLAGRYVLITSLTADQAIDRPGRRRLPPTADRRAPLPGAQGLLAPAPGAALDRTTRPRPHRRVRLRRRHRSAHHPRPRRRRRPRPRPPRPAPHRRPRAARTRTASAPSPSTPATATIDVVTRRTPLQARILAALDVDTTAWDRAHIHLNPAPPAPM